MVPVLLLRHVGLTLRVRLLDIKRVEGITDEGVIPLDAPRYPYLCGLLKIQLIFDVFLLDLIEIGFINMLIRPYLREVVKLDPVYYSLWGSVAILVIGVLVLFEARERGDASVHVNYY